MAVNNGSGKSEFSTEETVVEEDSVEPRLALEDKSAELLVVTLKMVNGMKLDVPNQSEETRLFLKLLEKTIFQFQESKFILLNVQEMDVVERLA